VSVIDAVSNAVIGTATVGGGPTGVAVHPGGTRVYVTNFAGGANTVSVIDTASNSTVATVAVGSSPFGIASNLTGTQIYVANLGGNSVSVIRTSDNAVVATVPVGIGPIALALSSDGSRMFVLNEGGGGLPSITAINTTDFSVATGPHFGGESSFWTQLVTVGSRIYATATSENLVYVFDADHA
jgi:YVTN family beta-propeller protein